MAKRGETKGSTEAAAPTKEAAPEPAAPAPGSATAELASDTPPAVMGEEAMVREALDADEAKAPSIVLTSADLDKLTEKIKADVLRMLDTGKSLQGPKAPAQDVVQVVNLREALFEVQCNAYVGTGEGARLDSGKSFRFDFLPGVNQVPAEKWKILEKHPEVQNHMRAGMMPNATDGLRVMGNGEVQKLPTFPALMTIEKSTDLEQLDRWAAAETRPEVKMAIQVRRDQVKRQLVTFDEKQKAAVESGRVHAR